MKTKFKIIMFFMIFLTNINSVNAPERGCITDIISLIIKLNLELKSIFKDKIKIEL